MSRAIGQNSMTPEGEQNSMTPWDNNTLNFRLARDQVVHLETAAICEPAIEVAQRFLLENLLFIIQKKGIYNCKNISD